MVRIDDKEHQLQQQKRIEIEIDRGWPHPLELREEEDQVKFH